MLVSFNIYLLPVLRLCKKCNFISTVSWWSKVDDKGSWAKHKTLPVMRVSICSTDILMHQLTDFTLQNKTWKVMTLSNALISCNSEILNNLCQSFLKKKSDHHFVLAERNSLDYHQSLRYPNKTKTVRWKYQPSVTTI